MDYGALLRGAWRVMWRHKYLWLLGLFASEGGCAASGGSPNANFSYSDDFRWSASGDEVADWITGNIGFILAVVFGLFVLGIALWALSILTTGGLIAGSDAAHSRRPGAGSGAAWAAGARVFWRLLGMELLVILAGLVLLIVFGLVVGLPVGLAIARGGTPGVGTVIGLILGVLLLLLLAIPAFVAIQITLTWARRALVLDGAGPAGAIGRGWRVFRSNLGKSLLVWLIEVGVSIAAGIALMVPIAIIGIPTGIGVYEIANDGVGPAAWGLLALAGLLIVGVLAVYKAAFTTFDTAYWTIAYRSLVPDPSLAALAAGGPSGGTWAWSEGESAPSDVPPTETPGAETPPPSPPPAPRGESGP